MFISIYPRAKEEAMLGDQGNVLFLKKNSTHFKNKIYSTATKASHEALKATKS